MRSAANEGVEGLCAAHDSVLLTDVLRRKTRLRDKLFQDLMKVCISANNVTAKALRVPWYKHDASLSSIVRMDCGRYFGCYLGCY